MQFLIGYVHIDQTTGFERLLVMGQCIRKALKTEKNPPHRLFRNLNRRGVVPRTSGFERVIRGLQGLSSISFTLLSTNDQFRRLGSQANVRKGFVILKRCLSERN